MKNLSKSSIIFLLLSLLILLVIIILQSKNSSRNQTAVPIQSVTPSVTENKKCVDINSLNCSGEIELSFECTEDYRIWAQANCPGWEEEQLLPISDTELSLGWYYGSGNQKKPNTPDDWIYTDAGRSSCWHYPGTQCGYLPD